MNRVPLGGQAVRMVNQFGEQMFMPVWIFNVYKSRDYLGFIAVEVISHVPGGQG